MTSYEPEKEGLIHKWTNYWTGWQPRWLVLSKGILSYYNNSDEVDKGCRASIKLSACDIIAYPSDNSRFDVVVKDEQRWYLKTSNKAERQTWLIALGSSKATTANENCSAEPVINDLKKAMNEMRLYCDLLIQQTTKVKDESQRKNPNSEILTETSSLLSTTCDTFITSIGTCLNLAEISISSSSLNLFHPNDHSTFAVPKLNIQKTRRKKSSLRANSVSSLTSLSSPTLLEAKELKEVDSKTQVSSSHSDLQQSSSDLFLSSFKSDDKILTFFSAMLHSFSDIVLEEDGGIPASSFLDACEGILPFLDTIGSKTFAPVKMDFLGNISKLRTKQESNLEDFFTLQSILNHEIQKSSFKMRNSATDALLWLKRGLRFIQQFLNNFKDGQKDLTVALNSAYAKTLKPYHSWVVKGVFAVSLVTSKLVTSKLVTSKLGDQ